MKITSIVLLMLILTATIALRPAENGSVFVNLNVTKNGRELAQPPQKITLMIGQHSTEILIRQGRFEVPTEILLAAKTERVGVLAIAAADQLRFSVDAGVFQHEIWSLRLADRRFDDYTQSLIPKGESPRSICVLEFSDKHSEVSAILASHCRTPVKK
jgi:hypothetical protein